MLPKECCIEKKKVKNSNQYNCSFICTPTRTYTDVRGCAHSMHRTKAWVSDAFLPHTNPSGSPVAKAIPWFPPRNHTLQETFPDPLTSGSSLALTPRSGREPTSCSGHMTRHGVTPVSPHRVCPRMAFFFW